MAGCCRSAGGMFDRVLLDAPCSGLGVLRRRPDARWRVTEASIGELAALQRELLAAAADLVRPGGCLVYSVCTLTRAETIDVDEWAAQHLDGFDAVAAPGRPGGRSAAARCSSRRPPPPTACSCCRCGATSSVTAIDHSDHVAIVSGANHGIGAAMRGVP